jgi:hypothetical protein
MKSWIRFACLAAALLAARTADAAFHLWDISEVFTSADGTVQFIEFVAPPAPGGNFQNVLFNHTIVTEEVGIVVLPIRSYTFLDNLPSNQTGGRRFLVATPAFEAAAGIAPDYVLDQVPFLDVGIANRLNFAEGSDFFDLAGLPTDGESSLFDGGGTGPNSPSNFAGEEGMVVPEPAGVSLGVGALAALLGCCAAQPRRDHAALTARSASAPPARLHASRQRGGV